MSLQKEKGKSTSLQSANVALLILLAAQAPAAIGAPYPGTGGALAAFRQMAPEGDPNNPFSYPLLKDIAKSMVRNGLPASFLLGMDSKNGPGIDLRSILLFEAGFFKSPVKLFMTPRQRKKSDSPTLSVESIPENSGEMPSAAPKLNPGSLDLDSDEAKSGEAATAAKVKNQREQEAAGLSLNLRGIKPDNSGMTIRKSKKGKSAALPQAADSDLATLAMIQPLSLTLPPPPDAQVNAFRFWTVPQALEPPVVNGADKAPYVGAFVMMSPGGLKGISGRKFSMTSGHLLACNDGSPMAVDTPEAKVKVDGGSTVLVEIAGPGVTRIRVIESSADKHVAIKCLGDPKTIDMQLSAGDDVLVSDHSLTSAEKAWQENPQPVHNSDGEVLSMSHFSPIGLLDSDKFFSTDIPHQSEEQRSALMSLRKRLK